MRIQDTLQIESKHRTEFARRFEHLHKAMVAWLDTNPSYEQSPWTVKFVITMQRRKTYSDATLLVGTKITIEEPEPFAVHHLKAKVRPKPKLKIVQPKRRKKYARAAGDNRP